MPRSAACKQYVSHRYKEHQRAQDVFINAIQSAHALCCLAPRSINESRMKALITWMIDYSDQGDHPILNVVSGASFPAARNRSPLPTPAVQPEWRLPE